MFRIESLITLPRSVRLGSSPSEFQSDWDPVRFIDAYLALSITLCLHIEQDSRLEQWTTQHSSIFAHRLWATKIYMGRKIFETLLTFAMVRCAVSRGIPIWFYSQFWIVFLWRKLRKTWGQICQKTSIFKIFAICLLKVYCVYLQIRRSLLERFFYRNAEH